MTSVDVPVPRRATVGDRVAWTVDDVFERTGGAVLAYLRAAGAGDSEDVLGEVFLRVARSVGRFDGDDGDVRRWVFTIARHCLMDEHRRATRQRRLLGRTPAPPVVPAPADPFDPELSAALDRLTEDQREVVTLRFVADLSLEEVARITRRPVGAVKSLQHRALRALAAALSRAGSGDD